MHARIVVRAYELRIGDRFGGYWPSSLVFADRNWRLFQANIFTHKLVSVIYLEDNGDELIVFPD